MAVGRSLHVGINEYSSTFPGAGKRVGPENAAKKMYDIAHDRGFQPDLVLGPKADRDTILKKLLEAAEVSQPEDIFLFTFSGHGTSDVLNADPDPDELDDEAILLYDFWLYDDELRLNVWPKFKKRVRVLMIADSCHSGTVLSIAVQNTMDLQLLQVSQETREAHLQKYGWFYRKLIVPVFAPVEASVLLLAACRDSEKEPDGDPFPPFTTAMVEVLEKQNPKDYEDLIRRIRQLVGPQVPQLTHLPPVNDQFIGQKPFTI